MRSSFIHFEEILSPLHPERPKLYAILAFLSAIGLRKIHFFTQKLPLFETVTVCQLPVLQV